MNVRRFHRSRRGFTLVEVLAALALFAIVIPVTMSGASMATRAGSIARHQAEAATLGEAKLNEMIVQKDWASGAAQGDFGADFPQYRWTLQTTQRDMGVIELVLGVTWQERGQPRTLNISTFVYAGSGTTGAASTGGLQ